MTLHHLDGRMMVLPILNLAGALMSDMRQEWIVVVLLKRAARCCLMNGRSVPHADARPEFMADRFAAR
jgi:hypothetical protein